MLNRAFWWLLRSLVGSRGLVYPSKQQACQGLNQFQKFNFSAVVAPLVVRTKKKQSNGNYETCKLHATSMDLLVHTKYRVTRTITGDIAKRRFSIWRLSGILKFTNFYKSACDRSWNQNLSRHTKFHRNRMILG